MGIYKITNIMNNKMYIGSSVNLKKRKLDHFRELAKNTHVNKRLQNSFNKYGSNDFKFEIIEIVKDRECLLKREQHWIDYFNSSDRTIGFNISRKAHAPMLLGSLNGMFGKTHTEEVKSLLKEKNSRSNNQLSKIILQFDLSGELLGKFESLSHASEDTGICKSGIQGSCSEKYKQSGGYIWIYEENLSNNYIKERLFKITTPIKKIKNKNSKPVIQLDKTFNFIGRFDSIYKASIETGFDLSSISKCCKNKIKTCNSYIFIYEEDYLRGDYKRDTKRKRTNREVIMCNSEYEIIKLYNSIKEAEDSLSIAKGSVSKCCKGKLKTAGGYKWMYLEDYKNYIKEQQNKAS